MGHLKLLVQSVGHRYRRDASSGPHRFNSSYRACPVDNWTYLNCCRQPER